MTTQIEIFGSKNQVIAILRVKVLKKAFTPAPVASAPTKKASKDKVIVHTDIRSKWQIGQELTHEFNAEINLTAKTIRIFGYQKSWDKDNKPFKEFFNRSFKVGDIVEYGSYNFAYTDPIEAITEKGVKINHNSSKSIMKLPDFINRNWDLDLVKIQKRRNEWSD